jgi:hypothetical protein
VEEGRARPSPALGLLLLCLVPALRLSPASSAEFQPPAGYHLVAEDDCGEAGSMPHVVRGKDYVYAEEQVKEPFEYRTIIFDNEFCLLRYLKPNPAASYKVDVVYVSQKEARRVQRLEANGHAVHDAMDLPSTVPGRFLFDLPKAATADGKALELKFINAGGANAVVCYVRLWSTDPTPLEAQAALWTPRGPVEQDWARQDRLRGKPSFTDWADAAKEVRESVVPCLNEQLDRGAKMLADQEALGGKDLDASARELADAARARDALLAAKSLDPEAWCKVYRDARWAVRRLAFKNPLLACSGLLFVRRHHPDVMHQCARRLATFTRPGGGLCILKELRADGRSQVVSITEGKFPNGTFSRPDLSFDAKRIVFGYASERQGGKPVMTYGQIRMETAPLFAHHEVGYNRPFQVWEMGLDGQTPPPRQLTDGPFESSDPLYLPNGRIAFMSERAGGLVQCGDWALAYCLFTMNPDGSDLRQITRSKEGEWDPCLLDDGSLLFTRWEYVMKFWAPIQMLWRVRPDGTNPHLIYESDLSRPYAYPLNYAAGRQVPGTSQVACIGSAHHNTGAGPVCVVDLRLGRDIADGLTRLTPVRFVETPDQQPDAGWYDCPYPLSDKYLLVSYSFSAAEQDTRGYGLYLLDAYGGKELLYRDRELSALFPTPLRPRPRPLRLAEGEPPAPDAPGELLILDVHQGLPASVRGQARHLLVAEAHERHVHTRPYDVQVGPDAGFETKTVLGTVPIERDGSAYFRLPAHKSVFFAVLDERHQALHVMRATTDVKPGERTGCVGCHEPMAQAPSNLSRVPLAAARAPSDLTPPPWGVRPMSYEALVQPLLDRHCVRCHDRAAATLPGDGTDPRRDTSATRQREGEAPSVTGPGEKKSFDLTARERKAFMEMPIPASYHHLRRYVRHAPIFSYFLPPLSFGSRVSPLMQALAKGHHGVALAPAEWQTLCAWIDCNAPYLDDYQAVAVKK